MTRSAHDGRCHSKFLVIFLILGLIGLTTAGFSPSGTLFSVLNSPFDLAATTDIIFNYGEGTFYIDTLHTDSWITSLYCWTPWCLEAAIQGVPQYIGKLSPDHRSNGTIALLTSYNESKVLGLQMTDTLGLKRDGPPYLLYNMSFVEGYEIKMAPIESEVTGLLGMGTIYGLQTTLTPFIFQLVANGDIVQPTITLTYSSISFGHLIVWGTPLDGDWTFIMRDNVVHDVPLGARDGTWNLIVENLLLNETSLGFNGLAVIDSLSPNITFPRAIANTIGSLLGATSYTIGDVDYYNMPCVASSTLPSINITTETGDLPILPDFYYVGVSPCYLKIIGKDIFSSTANPIWSFGLPLLMGYATTFNNTIGLETINFNMSIKT